MSDFDWVFTREVDGSLVRTLITDTHTYLIRRVQTAPHAYHWTLTVSSLTDTMTYPFTSRRDARDSAEMLAVNPIMNEVL